MFFGPVHVAACVLLLQRQLLGGLFRKAQNKVHACLLHVAVVAWHDP